MNNKGIYIAGLILLILGLIAGWNIRKKFAPIPDRVVIVDTAIQTVIKTELKKDTVIKWYERIIYKNVTPTSERVDRADTVFLKEVQYMDLMLKVKKDNDVLTIYAVNERDSVVKEYAFQNISDDFTATSMTGGIFVKSKKFDWNGLSAFGTAGHGIKGITGAKMKTLDYELGLKTGLNVLNAFDLNVSGAYNFTIKDLMLKGGLSINLIK